MAGASLLALLDDISTVLDDVATMTKVAARKTTGVLGDDLALNAEQVSGVRAERELPVVWAVAKGSMRNKLILVPAALLISWVVPWLVVPLLMLGGAYLCFEGVEKLAHKWLHPVDDAEHRAALYESRHNTEADLLQIEREKIQGAIRTDFILSAEIIVIALGTVASFSFMVRFGVLAGIAVLMTVGVYGLVAAIVKLDDFGLYLTRKPSSALQALGRGVLGFAPHLMKALSVLGTIAMFLVGGGILTHGLPFLHHWVEQAQHVVQAWPVGGLWSLLLPLVFDLVVGVILGSVVLAVVSQVGKLRGKKHA
ncbi:DUF808 domain-containing protein [Chitinibacteraceae bacterium HSL-7]